MPKVREQAITRHRHRMKRAGIVRVEVKVRREDAALVRRVALALSDPDATRAADARAELKRRFEATPTVDLTALLAAAPLEGIELVRRVDTGRRIGL